MIGNILLLICGKTYEANSAKNEVCDSLEVVRSREFDDDSTFLTPLRDGHTCVVRIGQGRHDGLPQLRQRTLLTGARTRSGLRLAQANDLFGGAHRESFRDDTLGEPLHVFGRLQGKKGASVARGNDLCGHLLLNDWRQLE